MSARDKEKYYWWKKNKNYYSNHKLKALEKEKNGYAYSILLEKIKCESTPYDGLLRFSEARAFTTEELAGVVDMPFKIVEKGLEKLKEKELIEIMDDGTIRVLEFDNCVGFETEAARRKREWRNGTNEGQKGDNVPKMSGQMSPRVKSQELRIDDDEIQKCARTLLKAGVKPEIIDEANDIISETKSPTKLFARIALAVEAKEPNIRETLQIMKRQNCTSEEMYSKISKALRDGSIGNKEGYIATIFRNEKEMRS